MIGLQSKYALTNNIKYRDLNGNTKSPAFTLYTKEDITSYLANPYNYQAYLRKAINYIYGASSHFRRLIQYFTSLTDFSYIVSPFCIDPKTADIDALNANYRTTVNMMSAMNARSQLPKILTVCLREDTFYGTLWVSEDSITIQQLPSDYCAITSIEGNVLNTTFNFSYFDTNSQYLEYYPSEFQTRFAAYKANAKLKWQELDSPTSFAVKVNNDILEYSLPPFAGVLREIYDLEDYKQLKLSKTALENYAMLVMTLGINEEGDWEIDLDRAKEFWMNLDQVLPEEIGSVLTPMPIEKVSFEKMHTGNITNISEAEQALFSAAGVSSLLFNNEKASSNALSLSIKADQAITFGIVKSIEDVINRYIQAQTYGKDFKVTFLDVSPWNRREQGDMYLKACQYGLPFISMYAATEGLSQGELDCMSFLENSVLGLTDMFTPLQSSATLSSTDNKGGAPTKDVEDLSDSGEQSREDA